ncbi:MAG: hypothetical protein LBG97_04750 [Coriobacteriales bacterium]|nr:hypothetical protein [Coriobacteriales bacterium]
MKRKIFVVRVTIIILVLFIGAFVLSACDRHFSPKDDDVIAIQTQEKALKLLENFMITNSAGYSISARHLADTAFDNPDYSFRYQGDNVEVVISGYLFISPNNNNAKFASLVFAVDLEKNTCDLKAANGNIDWDFIIEKRAHQM